MGGAPLDMSKIFPEVFKAKKGNKTTKKETAENASARRVDMINREYTRSMMNLARMGLK